MKKLFTIGGKEITLGVELERIPTDDLIERTEETAERLANELIEMVADPSVHRAATTSDIKGIEEWILEEINNYIDDKELRKEAE